jgi:signal transduction histidine kinase
MQPTESVNQPLVKDLRFYRWIIPAVIGALGTGYTLWESVLVNGYSVASEQAVMGFLLLGLVGPFLAFGTLTWALEGAKSWEQAQQAGERQRQHLAALNQVGEFVNRSLELDDVLNHAIDRVLDVMHLTAGEIRLLDDHHLEMRAARGVSAQFIDDERSIPLGHCVCGECAERGELMVIENIGDPAYSNIPCACEAFSSSVSVPVRTAERVIGVIHLASTTPRVFDLQERSLLTSMGYLVGAAVEKAQLHAELGMMNRELEERVSNRTLELETAKEELAQKAVVLSQVLAEERRVEEKTRSEIAHDLHDGVQQLIIGALYEMQAARERVDHTAPSVSEHIGAAQELLHQTESEMRRAIYDLRPLALDAQGLVPATRECIARFERMTNVKTELKIEGSVHRLPPEVEIAAFRIVQEALNNIQAHSKATHAFVCIRSASAISRFK